MVQAITEWCLTVNFSSMINLGKSKYALGRTLFQVYNSVDLIASADSLNLLCMIFRSLQLAFYYTIQWLWINIYLSTAGSGVTDGRIFCHSENPCKQLSGSDSRFVTLTFKTLVTKPKTIRESSFAH